MKEDNTDSSTAVLGGEKLIKLIDPGVYKNKVTGQSVEIDSQGWVRVSPASTSPEAAAALVSMIADGGGSNHLIIGWKGDTPIDQTYVKLLIGEARLRGMTVELTQQAKQALFNNTWNQDHRAIEEITALIGVHNKEVYADRKAKARPIDGARQNAVDAANQKIIDSAQEHVVKLNDPLVVDPVQKQNNLTAAAKELTKLTNMFEHEKVVNPDGSEFAQQLADAIHILNGAIKNTLGPVASGLSGIQSPNGAPINIAYKINDANPHLADARRRSEASERVVGPAPDAPEIPRSPVGFWPRSVDPPPPTNKCWLGCLTNPTFSIQSKCWVQKQPNLLRTPPLLQQSWRRGLGRGGQK